MHSKYNIPRKWQGKSTRDYRGLTNLRFSFARHHTGVSRRKLKMKHRVIVGRIWRNNQYFQAVKSLIFATYRLWTMGFQCCSVVHQPKKHFRWFSMFIEKYFADWSQLYGKTPLCPSEKVIHVYGIFRRLLGQHSNRSVLTPI